MDEALYNGRTGYYAGTKGGEDYATAGQISPVFGFALARLVSEFAGYVGDGLFTIVDIGCGDGTLLKTVVSTLPKAIAERCRFWGIDRASIVCATDSRIQFARDFGALPTEMPMLVITNELFDALPFARLVQRDDGLHELWVAGADGTLDWEERPAPEAYLDYFRLRGIKLRVGQFADVSLDWADLYGSICDLSAVKMILTFDYGYTREKLFDARMRRFGTAAAYYRHQVHRDLLARPGEQDLTAHINFSDLIEAGEERGFATLQFSRQAEFLLALGITEHPLFTPAGEVEVGSLNEAVEVMDDREAARRLILPDGIGEEMRVLVQGRGVPLEGWTFQRPVRSLASLGMTR